MRRRRLLTDVHVPNIVPDTAPAKPMGVEADAKPKNRPPSQHGAGYRRGTNNQGFITGEFSPEIKLDVQAFADMEKQEREYKRLIVERARELKWDQLKINQVVAQANRVIRMRALMKSNYARMTTDNTYRRRVQDPTSTESVFRFETSAQKQEAILNQMLGLDEMHEAKLAGAEAKTKPAEFQVIVGGATSKKHMAAGGGNEFGEDE